MNFIFGMMVGGLLFGGNGSNSISPLLGQIPFRCLGLIEKNVDLYKKCRRPSLSDEIWRNTGSHETLEENLQWEVEGLQELVRQAQQRQSDMKR